MDLRQDGMRTTGAIIRELRARTGLTQEQLAERTGMKRQHVSRLENDHRTPNVETLQRIIDACGLAVVLHPNPTP